LKIAGYEIDKSLAASLALHVGVLGWGVFSFSTRSLEAKPQDALPVDIISSEQLSQITKGIKTGQKENPKPMAEKVGDPKPVDDPVGKVTEKKEVIAANDKPPDPKPPEKKVEPPKPVEKKQEQQVDPIAEALKKEQQKKPVEKKETKAEPKKDEKPKKEYTFDRSKVAALLDKRDPTRQAVTGDVVNSKASFGTAAGQAQKLTMNWVGALQRRIGECWNMPVGIADGDKLEIRVYFELRRDGSLAGAPRLVSVSGATATSGPAASEGALRAIQQCQPYTFLPQAEYVGGWDRLDLTFDASQMFRR
jgi:outer membrane biosynthesis protein TonB